MSFLTGFIFFLFLLLFPSLTLGAVSGDVIINEVMWKGTSEWIELYNNTNNDIEIDRWTIKNAKSGDKALENINGTISVNGYFLICNEASIGGINCNFPNANLSLKDTCNDKGCNGNLILQDSNNSQIDVAEGDPWPAGKSKSSNYYSMERVNPKVSGGEKCNWQTTKIEKPAEIITKNEKTYYFYGTPGDKNSQSLEIDCTIFSANAGGNIISTTGRDISFDASNSKGIIEKYIWNFGDGSTQEGKVVTHRYKFPNTYYVSLEAIGGEKEDEDLIEVQIFSDSIFISEFSPKEKWLEISNKSGFIEDISGFSVSTKNEKDSGFVFPNNSFIVSNGVLFISSDLLSCLSFGNEGSLFLFYPSDDIKQEIKYTLPAGVDNNWSISRKGSDYFYTKTKTPGKQNLLSGENKESSSGPSSSVPATGPQGVSKVPQETKETQKSQPARRIFSSNLLAEIGKDKALLALSGLGVACFSGFLGLSLVKLRRKMKNKTIGAAEGRKKKEIIELEIEE